MSDKLITTSDLTVLGDEPRVLDVALAESLGMARPDRIRDRIIEPNREELESFGSLSSAVTNPGPRGGRPGTAFYLNRQQALLVCILSRTQRAKEVRSQVVRVFTEWQVSNSSPVQAELELPPVPEKPITLDDVKHVVQAAVKHYSLQVIAHTTDRIIEEIKGPHTWAVIGGVKRVLRNTENWEAAGLLPAPVPTDETTFATSTEVCWMVLPEDAVHSRLPSVVSQTLLSVGRTKLWRQGGTQRRSKSEFQRPTFPLSGVKEWLADGGAEWIRTENDRLHATASPRVIRVISN